MSEDRNNRHSERPARSGVQIFALVLAILYFAQAAIGVYLINTGLAEWVNTAPHYYPLKPIGSNFEISLGTIALTGIVPGILLALLFARITKARVRANAVGVAFVWLVFLMFGATTGAWSSGFHPGFMVLAILPALYTACVVACARSMRATLGAGAGSAS